MSTETSIPKKILLKPIIISNNKKMVIKSPKLLTNVNFPARIQQYKEEVVYQSSSCDFLKGESQEVLILNRVNLFTKSCRTIARCSSRGVVVETTSDNVSSVIGQKNYETVLSALSSIFNQETKVRGILSLLTAQKKYNTVGIQTNIELSDSKKKTSDMESQTDEYHSNMFLKEKPRKRIRRQPLTPYVVTEDPCKVRKFVINIDNVKKELKPEKKIEKEKEEKTFPDLKLAVDEDSNISSVSSNVSLASWPSLPDVLENAQKLLTEIDKVTDKTLNSSEIGLRDGSKIMIPVKPEDMFHIATPEILKNVTHEERVKLICHQAFIDFKMCIVENEDGYFPLHIAVLNGDADLVRRQCAALKARHESVDIPANGMTALQMAVRQNVRIACTSLLLQNGADPLLCDQERRSSFHLAAETDSLQLRCLLTYCDKNARSVLKHNQDFWKSELEQKTDEQIKRYFYNCVGEMFDEQGYTPLMIAAEAGLAAHAAQLAARAPALVDAAAPHCGATALYRLVAKACLHHKETNSITTPEKFLKTIEVLLENGADPSIENHSGSSVNTLLTEFNISALSMTIANKMTAMRHGKYASDKLMLYKHIDGRIGYKDINNVSNDKDKTNVATNVHAIITVDIPDRQVKKVVKRVMSTDGEDTDRNVKLEKESPSTSAEVNSNDSNVLNRINEKKDLKLEHTYLRQVMHKNLSLKEISANRLSDAIKNAKNDTNISLKANVRLNDADDHNTRRQILGNIGLEHFIDADRNAKDNTPLNAIKLSVKGVKDGNLGNLTLKRLSTGKMIAVTQAKIDKTSATTQNANIKSHMKLIKVKPLKVLSKDVDNDLSTQISPNEIEVNTNSDEPERSKERKTENVVIVENVPLKGFSIPNIIKPGTSKTAKPRDIVISPRVNSGSPEIVIREENETVDNLSKRRKVDH